MNLTLEQLRILKLLVTNNKNICQNFNFKDHDEYIHELNLLLDELSKAITKKRN